jgi:hypothetical protein
VENEPARSGWTFESCPRWCTRQHDDDDHPDDRYHDSAPTTTPTIFLQRDHEAGPGRWRHEAGEITIISSRHADTDETITFIGRDDRFDQQLHLTPEGAARLADAIVRHLAQLQEPTDGPGRRDG